MLHWTVTAAIFSVITYYTYNLQQMDHVANPTESGIYTGGTRISWSVFLCLVIYACVKGYGGPVNWFLSLPLWQPLARLTYAIYLIHLPAMLLTAAATRRPVLLTGRYVVSQHIQFEIILFFRSVHPFSAHGMLIQNILIHCISFQISFD